MIVGSVANAARILRYMALAGRPLGVNAVARELDVSVSSCFNILRTLAAEDFLVFDTSSKLYRISPRLAGLFGPSPGLESYRELVAGYMRQVSEAFCVTCGLWERAGERLVLRLVSDSPARTRIHMVPGQRLPIHAGAMGRCVSAHEKLPRGRVPAVLATVRWEEPPTAESYWRDVLSAAAEGWSIDEGAFLRGVTTIAAPVLDAGGAIAYCLTATMFEAQHGRAARVAIAARVMAVAGEVEALARTGGRGAAAPPR